MTKMRFIIIIIVTVITTAFGSLLYSIATDTGIRADEAQLNDLQEQINYLEGLIDNLDLFSGDYNDLSNQPNLFSGNYNDLSNKPTLFTGNYNDLSNKPNLFSGSYNDLTNQPNLFSGSYNDLSNKPTLSIANIQSDKTNVSYAYIDTVIAVLYGGIVGLLQDENIMNYYTFVIINISVIEESSGFFYNREYLITDVSLKTEFDLLYLVAEIKNFMYDYYDQADPYFNTLSYTVSGVLFQ